MLNKINKHLNKIISNLRLGGKIFVKFSQGITEKALVGSGFSQLIFSMKYV
jgi:hypothetical protein